jgi:hypothetical protein
LNAEYILLLIDTDVNQSETFFIGRPPTISVQDVLNSLVHNFNDPPGVEDGEDFQMR